MNLHFNKVHKWLNKALKYAGFDHPTGVAEQEGVSPTHSLKYFRHFTSANSICSSLPVIPSLDCWKIGRLVRGLQTQSGPEYPTLSKVTHIMYLILLRLYWWYDRHDVILLHWNPLQVRCQSSVQAGSLSSWLPRLPCDCWLILPALWEQLQWDFIG